MNFTDFAEIELKGLEKEARAVNQQLAAKTTKLLQSMIVMNEARKAQMEKSFDGISTKSQAVVNDVLSLLLSVYQTKHSKLVTRALSILQRIMHLKGLSKAHFQQILSHLIRIKHWEDVDVQRRIIQISLNFITPELLSLEDMEFIVKVYSICFQLANCKQQDVQQISIGALLQLTSLIFSDEKFKTYNNAQLKIAYDLLAELLQYIVEKKALEWVPPGMLGVVWDLVMEVFCMRGPEVMKEGRFHPLVKKMIDITVKKSFQKVVDNKFDFVRFFRGYVYMVVYLHVGQEHLRKFQILADMDHGFVFMVHLEGLLKILGSQQLCSKFDVINDIDKCFQIVLKRAEQLCIGHQMLNISNKKAKKYLDTPTVLLNLDPHQQFEDTTIYLHLATFLIRLRESFESQFRAVS